MAAHPNYKSTSSRTARPPLLLVFGHDGDAVPNRSGGYRASGGCDVYKLLPERLPFDQVNLAPQFSGRQKQPDFSLYPCIFNLVTDADQHPRTLASLQERLRGVRGRVLNHPEAVMQSTRERVAERLAGTDGLRVPRTLRLASADQERAAEIVERAGLAYPLIVRKAGTHTGQTVRLVGDDSELANSFSGPEDHIVTEYVELRGPDGLYRKYRVYFFGQGAVYRNLYFSEDWNVHSHAHRDCLARRPELMPELQSMFQRPEGAFPPNVRAMLMEVRRRMPLDYFGMDFGFTPDGEAVLFEANASMSFVPSWPDVQFRHCLKPAWRALRDLLAEAIVGRGRSHQTATATVKY
jgi:glutathione synthase/RimK-type ligase-like ATP-grasp enzyme